jgi:hypothetical protein
MQRVLVLQNNSFFRKLLSISRQEWMLGFDTANRDGVELCVDFGVDPIGTRIDTAIDTSTTKFDKSTQSSTQK